MDDKGDNSAVTNKQNDRRLGEKWKAKNQSCVRNTDGVVIRRLTIVFILIFLRKNELLFLDGRADEYCELGLWKVVKLDAYSA